MHPRRRSSKAVTPLLLLGISVVLYGRLLFSPLGEQNQRRVEEDAPETDRPVMYTFFQQRENEHGNLLESETKETDEQIRVWKELWNKAGWDAQVLTIEDAQKHPDYEKYSHDILENPAFFYGGLYSNSYNFMCFMRWLAMAAHGEGGWMSDYDTIPMGITPEIGKTLPNDGAFTGYDRHVPSLLSGSAEEWNRLGTLILEQGVENIQKIEQKEIFSDMMALKNIHDNDESAYIQESKVLYEYPYHEMNEIDCHQIKGFYAAHLSHHASKEALSKGLIQSPDNNYYNTLRPGWARDLDERWRTQCLSETE